MQKVTSIDGQLLLCRKVAARNSLDVVGEFVDAAKSGLTEDTRDGYQRLLEGVRKQDFDVIIVEHFDRLSRDPAAGTITLSPTEEFPAHTPMVIGRGRARLASG